MHSLIRSVALLAPVLFFANLASAQAAEPDASPEPLENQPIVLQQVWPADGATLSLTPEIWVRLDPVELSEALLIETESGVVHPLLILNAEDPEFGRTSGNQILAFRNQGELPPATEMRLVVTNENEGADLAHYTTTSGEIADPVVPLLTPTLNLDVGTSTVFVEFLFDEDKDFDTNVLGVLVAKSEDGIDGFEPGVTSVYHRDGFDSGAARGFIGVRFGNISGPTDETDYCIALGVIGVNQTRIEPDFDEATCITLTLTEAEWSDIKAEQERLAEDDVDQLACSDSRPASNPGPTSAVLIVFAFGFALRRTRR